MRDEEKHKERKERRLSNEHKSKKREVLIGVMLLSV